MTRLRAAAAGAVLALYALAQVTHPGWKHLSTTTGDLEPPNTGQQQTSATIFDANKDGINDFVITERTATPSVVLYLRHAKGWTRHVIDGTALRPEAGAAAADIDNDGDIDFTAGGDARSNEIWWWENPHPAFDPKKPWTRHLIKNTGATKHHDQLFADVDADGRLDFVFWNQNARALFFAQIPKDPRNAPPWPHTPIYTYSTDSEPEQRGTPERFKGVHEHEGLAVADIDLDGKLDIVGGGRWFKHIGGTRFAENLIDPAYTFSRAASGQLKKGGRPEVVLVVGDGKGPLLWYEWTKGTWVPHHLAEIDSAHSLDLVDFNGDGNLDIFCAGMRLNNRDPEAKIRILLGDGAGNFEETVVATGFGLHESKIADLDGDGRLDILGKPYNWNTPRLDVWLRHDRI